MVENPISDSKLVGSPLHCQSQEEESDDEEDSAYASSETTSSFQPLGTSVNTTGDEVSSLLQSLKNQEEQA